MGHVIDNVPCDDEADLIMHRQFTSKPIDQGGNNAVGQLRLCFADHLNV